MQAAGTTFLLDHLAPLELTTNPPNLKAANPTTYTPFSSLSTQTLCTQAEQNNFIPRAAWGGRSRPQTQ